MIVRPVQTLRGTVRVPGDKSISHRAAILAAIARGRSRLENFSTARDCAATLRCLEQLGAAIEREASTVIIEGAAGTLIAPRSALDCGNSGTTMRLLAGVLAGCDFESELTGDESLRSRPMRRIISPLERMGAQIDSDGDRAPLRIRGRRPLGPLVYELSPASAQVKSCVLLAGLSAHGRTRVDEIHTITRDHTERLLRWFGASVVETFDEASFDDKSAPASAAKGKAAHRVSVEGIMNLAARDVSIPGDISSAAFLIAAAAMLPGSRVTLTDVGLNPTRTRFLEILREMNVKVRFDNVREESNEPRGCITIENRNGRRAASEKIILRGASIAQVIDELPLLAVVGTQTEGGLEIRDAAELRVKESDRIRAMAENLRRMNADVEEMPDGLRVAGRAQLRGARLESYGDHRIAMACAVAALVAEGESEIVGAECVSVSFPEFFTLLGEITER